VVEKVVSRFLEDVWVGLFGQQGKLGVGFGDIPCWVDFRGDLGISADGKSWRC